MSKQVYHVKIDKFFLHNSKSKKGHTHFMVSKRIFNDEKISKLKPIEFQLYLYCLSICADIVSNEFEISAQMLPKYMRIGAQSLRNYLNRLQSFQLLTIEKTESFINRIEKKEIEKKRKEKNLTAPQNVSSAQKPVSSFEHQSEEKNLNRKIWQSYFDAYTLRYGVEPVRNGRINAQVSQLGKRLGAEAVEVVKFYLTHNDGFYLKNSHAIGLCLKDAESLHSQWKRGVTITASKVKQFEKQNSIQETIEALTQREV
jgi:hypothetical protein